MHLLLHSLRLHLSVFLPYAPALPSSPLLPLYQQILFLLSHFPEVRCEHVCVLSEERPQEAGAAGMRMSEEAIIPPPLSLPGPRAMCGVTIRSN